MTLVFCETCNGNFDVGKRIFDVSVFVQETYEFTDIDVFAEVGENTIHTITIQNVPAEYEIVIELKKGTIENPFISGLLVGAVENASAKAERPAIPDLEVTVTQEQYDECIANIDAYIAEAKETKPDGPIREVPQFMFHEAETPVRGLVVTFHGFSGRHYDHRTLNRYLYDNGYDVLNTMLSGHMHTGKYWPSTKLSKEYGGDTVAADIMSDPELTALAGGINRKPCPIPLLLTKLRQANPDFERVISSQTYMKSLDEDEDPNTQRSLVNYIDPLGIAPDFAWNPETPFPVSAFTAVGRFGGSINSSENTRTSSGRNRCRCS